MTDPKKSNLQLVDPTDEADEADIVVSPSKAIAEMRPGKTLEPSELDRRGLIYSGGRNETALNAFRELRTQLLAKTDGENFVAVVTSVCPGGGATHVAMNLASAIALDKSKTALIVDCNWRDPSLHNRMNLVDSPGLLDFLDFPEDVGVKAIIRPTAIPRLRVIPIGSGGLRYSEHFSSMNMRLLIQMLKQRYPDRFIILDAPSIKNGADVRMLTQLADLAVLVVPYGRSTTSQVEEAASKIGGKLAGLVFNRQPGG